MKAKKSSPLSIEKVNTVVPDSCLHQRQWMSGTRTTQEQYKTQYDSLRRYVESCAVLDNDYSYHAFSSMDAAVQEYEPNDTSRYTLYRQWLVSVIYLNTTQEFYFCSCLLSIASTYKYGKFDPTNATISILRYIRDHTGCDHQSTENEIKKDSLFLIRNHKDTTIPSLEDLGLGFLLTHNSVSPSTVLPTIYLASFTSSPNPFKTETTLSFELNRMAYVTVEVFDPLGRKVWGDEHGYSLDKGIHTVHLDGAKFSSGTYYARISTGFGEVKTVKLVKQ